MQNIPSRPLGASGLVVFPLGLGTNRWALGQHDEAIFAVYRASLAAGVNFIDTAEVYNAGKSERLVGASIRRDSRPVVVATKFAPLPTRLTARQFMRALDASLSRLDRAQIANARMNSMQEFYSGFRNGRASERLRPQPAAAWSAAR